MTVPDRSDWIHEIKHDGYRLIVQREGQRARLFTRNGHDWSDRFPLGRVLIKRIAMSAFRGRTGKHLLLLSFTGF